MSLTTQSLFYYGHEITSDNYLIDFDEGGGELTATLALGSYTLAEFVAEIKRVLDAAGALTYTVSVNRTTRIITISADGNFDLLTNTGTHVGTAPWDLMGYTTTANKTGAATYAADNDSGESYHTQFVPQSYVGPDDLQEAVDATVHESAAGDVQVFRFGTNRFIEMNLMYITSRDVTGSVIRNNPTGVSDAQAFLQYSVRKNRMEFMEDADSPGTFQSVLLESTPEDSKGVGYRLRELYGRGLPEFFETGVLKFRVLE